MRRLEGTGLKKFKLEVAKVTQVSIHLPFLHHFHVFHKNNVLVRLPNILPGV